MNHAHKGQQIRELRHLANLSQFAVEKTLGIDTSRLSLFENGHRDCLTAEELKHLEDYLRDVCRSNYSRVFGDAVLHPAHA